MKQYIKKPIEITAIQFTYDNKDIVFNLAKEIQQNITPSRDVFGNPSILIPTLEGEMECTLGDYIIVEPFPTDWRKLYPCKESIFLSTYIEKQQ